MIVRIKEAVIKRRVVNINVRVNNSMLSVIIPVYNEEYALAHNADFFKSLSDSAEVIFVDGGSSDNTLKCAKLYGRVIESQRSRAVQMNSGAKVAQHDMLLFLHADSILQEGSVSMIKDAVENRGYVGGCFCQSLDHPGLIYKWIAFTGNVRARIFRIFYGDQGIFVRKDVFWQLGGFPEVAICEDVLFTKNLRKMGKVGVLCQPIHCSARRWLNQGILKTSFLNMRITIGLLLGSNQEQLAKLYQDVR